MSKIVHCEWLNEQPGFTKEVKRKDGTVIGTIHALTKSDYAKIAEKSNGYKNIYDYALWSIVCSLIGHDAGWNFDKDVSYENVDMLPKEDFKLFMDALKNFEDQNVITEGTEKN